MFWTAWGHKLLDASVHRCSWVNDSAASHPWDTARGNLPETNTPEEELKAGTQTCGRRSGEAQYVCVHACVQSKEQRDGAWMWGGTGCMDIVSGS